VAPSLSIVSRAVGTGQAPESLPGGDDLDERIRHSITVFRLFHRKRLAIIDPAVPELALASPARGIPEGELDRIETHPWNLIG